MKKNLSLTLLALSLISLYSCNKETSLDNGGTNANCNTVVMKLKKWYNIADPNENIEITYDNTGKLSGIRVNTFLSEISNATYLYSNNRISEAVLRNNDNNSIYDTAVYHYNAAGKPDSIYRKQIKYFNLKFTYDASGRLVKLLRYNDTQLEYYWEIQNDTRGNIKHVVEWEEDGNGGFQKATTLDYIRDDRKNPFESLAAYMFYLDDETDIFRIYGPNNYTDETFLHHFNGATATTGHKYTYNDNCYPAASRVTLSGMPIFTDDDYKFEYY